MDPSETSRETTPGRGNSTDAHTARADNGYASTDTPSLEELVDDISREELRRRQHTASSTERGAMNRCPECDSVKIRQKLDKPVAQATQKPGDYRCDVCNHHFDEPDTTAPATDGGHPDHSPGSETADCSSAEAYYIVDEARPAVIDGPLSMARARCLANEHGPDHIVASRDAIQLLKNTGDTTVRWEINDDADIATDGGHLARRDDVDAVRGDAGVGDQAPGGGCRHSDDDLECPTCFLNGGQR
jgi:rubredoxin